ncbi:lysophospholipase L1-like esterase [Kineosphaera limosa]|uniref:SGNH hydrolase-type esterase domain-containing protein n=1 Tax=Kineosphaera limosa NBRC 100340 TaxID=1184609 RepID=K6VHG1_9MICO|nr:SGNH/GDSL hydrolase family protein [Kineosphaera limosa]NYD99688.1 lysophospholipase L1-like esterase [Kineosphaera limosa]GAB95643.1 hypothetical protein KILIM_024_00530 [Kineosphaera limosa NBRC 100340]
MITTRDWGSYVAIGDSFSEGMSDPDPARPGTYIGWADRLAGALAVDAAEHGREFSYANLAIRGRKLADITDRQLPLALELRPDLVSIVGGGNDILRPRADIEALAARLEQAVAAIRATGADVLLATPTDPREAPLLKHIRGRNAIFTAHIWAIARRHRCGVVDLWGNDALRDWRMWGPDRIHLSTAGHERVAASALAALGHGEPDGAWGVPMPGKPSPNRSEQRRSDREWARAYLGPWVRRRLTGRSSGDGRDAKRPTLAPIGTLQP